VIVGVFGGQAFGPRRLQQFAVCADEQQRRKAVRRKNGAYREGRSRLNSNKEFLP
jgi:hypothetical protein